MRLSMVRRLDRLAKAHAARRRTHYLFRGVDEIELQVDARIGAMIASGKAGPNDRFVVFSWRSPADADDN
jgi:hypothetical protein